ncbi:hypothetical protein [Arthrobacter sp. 179]|uniref:hypothetical protein n=1 Tax=Arthrobacter sp. 179 TaxID=3457734 RepID=UPI0040336065
MSDVLHRDNPLVCDVAMIASFDVPETLGIDMTSDLQKFIQLGLSVVILPLMQSGAADRYRNVGFAQEALSRGVPIAGSRDFCQAKLAIIYSGRTFVDRALTGHVAADDIAVVVDGGADYVFDPELHQCLDAAAEPYSGNPVTIFAANKTVETKVKAALSAHDVHIWNFHVSDFEPGQLRSSDKDLGEIGVVLPPLSVGAHEARRDFLKKLKNSSGAELLVHGAIPSDLQTANDEDDLVIGWPFTRETMEKFVLEVDALLIPREALTDLAWRPLLALGLAVKGLVLLLPREMEVYLGDAAAYFDDSPMELFGPDSEMEDGVSRHVSQDRTSKGMLASLCGLRLLEKPQQLPEIELLGTTELPVADSVVKTGSYDPVRVCFVTSNGAGMGHLSRLLGISRKLPSHVSVSFISMSQACAVVADYGYEYFYIPSLADMNMSGGEWNPYFAAKFLTTLEVITPTIVVFDGTWPYWGISEAAKNLAVPFVWIRRGMWRATTPSTSLVQNTWFDKVIAPGDLASDYDRGITTDVSDATEVGPILLVDPDELDSRDDARSTLGIDTDKLAVLITLGAGNINKIDEQLASVLEALERLPMDIEIFMTKPPIAENGFFAKGIRELNIYPLAKLANAFDFVVSATGYNSFHEWIAYKVPALWLPNLNTVTDDQIQRAIFASDAGLGHCVVDENRERIVEAIENLAKPSTREKMRLSMANHCFINGAGAAAKLIFEIAEARS